MDNYPHIALPTGVRTRDFVAEFFGLGSAYSYRMLKQIITHPDKTLIMRVSGSLAFVAAARAAFLVAQDPNDDNRHLLLPMKNNIGNATKPA